jgi:hypothetical protein
MPRREDVDPSFRKAVRILAPLLAAACLIFSLHFTLLAPFGFWKNEMFGQTLWRETDPSGVYIDAAHRLVWGEAPLWVLHPGTTMTLMLAGIQHAYYALASDPGFTFTEFIARNLPTVFVLSKLMMTLVHLASFFLIFVFANRLLRDERAAFFAVLGYATSLPVLFFLSRISPEPLVVICFLLSTLAIWRYQDLARDGQLGGALWLAAFSAAVAVSGTVTKLNFLGPLPFFLMLYVLAGGWGENTGGPVAWRTRILALLVFTVVGAALAMVYSQIIDWSRFFMAWRLMNDAWRAVPWRLESLLPGTTPERIFLLSELVYVALGIAGWINFLRRNPEQRIPALWVSAYGGYALLLFAYRIMKDGNFLPFHYFHLANAVVAIFFGYTTVLVLRHLPLRLGGWQAACFGLVWVAVIHLVAVWATVDSRLFDAASYTPNRETYGVIARLEPGERLGLVRRVGIDPVPLKRRLRYLHCMPMVSLMRFKPERANIANLQQEFESFFTLADASEVPPNVRGVFLPPLGGRVMLLPERKPIPLPED